ncbi:hypothetical protein OpiT1DRAFT_04348 [Opitutaceae bacterium TAV1]|nr:hypothetical protein OpiT1DRAFT_04348 [Opitutaceae bacterium TAV1]
MSNPDYIPASDESFHEWQQRLMTAIDNRATEWSLPAAAVTQLQGKQTFWNEGWEHASNPATRTAANVLLKNEARKSFEGAIRAFVKSYLAYNPAVTDADRVNAGLPVHKAKPVPVPVPTTYPEFEVTLPAQGRVVIHFHDAGKKTGAKPFGVHGAEVAWVISAAAPGSHTELTRSSFDTHSPLTLDFDLSQRGQLLWLCLRWENTRGEKGPWSAIASTVIP